MTNDGSPIEGDFEVARASKYNGFQQPETSSKLNTVTTSRKLVGQLPLRTTGLVLIFRLPDYQVTELPILGGEHHRLCRNEHEGLLIIRLRLQLSPCIRPDYAIKLKRANPVLLTPALP